MQDITLVIPAKSEADSLPKVLKELKNFSVKKIIIMPKNDFITIKSIKKYKSKIIFQKKDGYGSALNQGILSVKTKYFCIFNADGAFNPKYLKKMREKLRERQRKKANAKTYNNINKNGNNDNNNKPPPPRTKDAYLDATTTDDLKKGNDSFASLLAM